MTEGSTPPGFDSDIAVVGMAGRFPGARTIADFWDNLRSGVESLTTFSDEELLAAGVNPADLADPNYVKSGGVLPDMEMFDAGFFGFNPREASIMDPQHRHFLECAWEALEDAGHPPDQFSGSVGVFGGSGHNAYMPYNLLTNPKLMASVGFFLIRHTGNDKDFLTTRVSYLLDLKGPSVNVQTACSTSLVAMHMGCQSLLSRECDMALAGGVTIELPHRHGYLYREGEILSPDGHCRPFDADSKGTVFGSGVGVVVLRRLADALADGDHIHAVIKGSAVNNDGAGKVGYMAPSVDGQAQSIAEALGISGIPAETISYVEAHGTGTPVGDPIEVAALTQAFRQETDKTGFSGIGSVKSNIGHLDTAAGIASFMKVALAMQHREIPPTLHFRSPNSACEFERSPFQVTSALTPWNPVGIPRRAGVSSLGVGGTNAHLIVEEAPPGVPSGPSRPLQLLTLSAKTATALDAGTAALAEHLESPTDQSFPDTAWTLQVGRQAMKHRRITVAASAAEAASLLREGDPQRVVTHVGDGESRSVAFMFAGGGAQYPNMAADLYQREAVFREAVDACLSVLSRRHSLDLKQIIFPAAGQEAAAAAQLERPSLALPALFTTQFAQARLWMSWGVTPAAMIGHSMGEYTAAHLAGVFSLEDALALVELRGRLFESLPGGGMLSVGLPAEELSALLGPELSIAAVNGPRLSVASGPVKAIDALAHTLERREIDAVRVRISVAAHSSMLEPILKEFGEFFKRIKMMAPSIPFVSNLSGSWITPAEAMDPSYWVRHLRSTVRFADGLEELLKDGKRILLEVGPGRTLATLARQHPSRAAEHPVLNSLRHPDEKVSDLGFMLGALGRVWAFGGTVDWNGFRGTERRRRVSLPTYRFDHKKHWIEPGKTSVSDTGPDEDSLARRDDIGEWFSQPVWRRVPPPSGTAARSRVLVFLDDTGLGDRLTALLRARGDEVTAVRAGAEFLRSGPGEFTIDARAPGDYVALIAALAGEGRSPREICHLWTVSGQERWGSGSAALAAAERLGFNSLLFLAQAIGGEDLSEPIHLVVGSDHLQRVAGESARMPAKALVLGPCKVIPREFPNLRCRSVDVGAAPSGSWQEARQTELLASELFATDAFETIAHRASERWVEEYQAVRLDPVAAPRQKLRPKGVYLITGGLGGVGLALARHLARTVQARLVLVGRGALPPREQWDDWLTHHDADQATSRRIRQVMQLESLGAEVMVAAADVTDLARMKGVIGEARSRFGTLHGVLHTAGVLHDGVIQLKDPAVAASVLAPKVQGTLVLEEALAGAPLDFLVLFSSVSSFSGLAGQVDYAAANAFLDAYAQDRIARDGTHTVAVNWSAWQEVGMAAAMAEQLGIVQESAGESAGVPVGHPLVDRCVRDAQDERVYATRFSTATHWILDEHRVRDGDPLIPGAGYLELVRAAFAHHPQDRGIEMRDITFLSPFAVPAGTEKELRIRIRRSGHGPSQFSVVSRAAGVTPAWTEHVRGTVAFADLPAATRQNPKTILDRCRVRAQVPTGTDQPVHLVFGPRWNNVTRADYGADEALLSLELPGAFTGDLDQFALHPALVDMATAGAQSLIPDFDERKDFFVPASYGVVQVYGRLPRRLFSHIRLRRDESTGGDLAVFDITLMDEGGTLLVEIAEFTMIRVRDKSLLGSDKGSPAPVPGASEGPSRPQPTANSILAIGLRDGIRTSEGAEALERILAWGVGPQVVVSPQPLGALIRQLRAPAEVAPPATAPVPSKDVTPLESALSQHPAIREAAAAIHGDHLLAYVVYDPQHTLTVSELRRHLRGVVSEDLVPQTIIELDVLPRTPAGALDRVALPNPFGAEEAVIAPRTDMERTIGGLWQELLGVPTVGVYDNFFDIGGHSLLSVRFISRLDKKAGVRLQHEHVVVNTLEQLAAKCDRLVAERK